MIFKKVSFNGGKSSFVAPSWEQMGVLSFRLALMIEKSGVKFDRLVALAKGGWTWARTLVDYLGIEELDSMRIRSYQGIGKKGKTEILQSVTADIKGESILIFDDVADSGATLKEAREHVLSLGAGEVKTATLFLKPDSLVVPDYFIHETSAWIVFPHEIWEFIKETGTNWLKKGVKPKEILERYTKLNLPEEQVRYLVAKLVKTEKVAHL